MDNNKTIEALNTLITINNDRIEGYETAMNETKQNDLKALFLKLSHTSQHCKRELTDEVMRLGGTPADGTLISGKFFRVWMDVKAALTGDDRKYILDSCEYGEDAAKDTYEKIIEDEMDNLSQEQQTMILTQNAMLQTDHDTVKYMRDNFDDEK
jgi:uncharacterized protein (TIGR02284 family)